MLLRLEDRTPAVYTEESRDFQLFLRLYDCINNMVKYDIDAMECIKDTSKIKTELLPLLQTKVGFFTNYEIDSEMLRAILTAFPVIVKNKGSLEGVKEAVRVFLKVLGVKTELEIFYSAEGVSIGGYNTDDHTVIIGINEAIENFYILEELFRYILPAGFSYMFYFYKNMGDTIKVYDKQSAYHFTIGQDINSSIRYRLSAASIPVFSTDSKYVLESLTRKPLVDDKIYKCIRKIDNPGECTVDNWNSYWQEFDPEQDANYDYANEIKNILINSADTILVYDSRNDIVGTNGTVFTDVGGGLDE